MSKKTKTTKDKFPTEKTAGDAIHTIAKVGIGMIPIVSAPASELLNCLVTPPLEKRRIEFLEDVGRRLKDLEDREIISLKELPENEKFIDITMLATQAALRTSEKEKRLCLEMLL